MLLTYKVPHNLNLKKEFDEAIIIAEKAIVYGKKFGYYFKDTSLPSAIAQDIHQKYYSADNISNIILPVRGQAIKFKDNVIRIFSKAKNPNLRINFAADLPDNIIKINYIEIMKDNFCIICTVEEKDEFVPEDWCGVDLNSTGHITVLSDLKSGNVIKYNKDAPHMRNKFNGVRKKMQSLGAFKFFKSSKNKENRVMKDINHKISYSIVTYAQNNNIGIRMEDLSNIRNTAKHRRKGKSGKKQTRVLNFWSFYQLMKMVEYKAKLHGVPFELVKPEYTSKRCSRCGRIGYRNKKVFRCNHCGHSDHADVNAGFNIAADINSMIWFDTEREVSKDVLAASRIALQLLKPLSYYK
jgi:putative transposase